MEKQIRVYQTHIEIYPYVRGEEEKFENSLSIFVDAEYRFDRIGFYIENQILYVPRGINIYYIEKTFHAKAVYIHGSSVPKIFYGVNMKFPPRNKIQDDAIDFLTCRGKYKKAIGYSQQALILDTGDGKTFAAVSAILDFAYKAIIITHQDNIKNQWIKTFKNMTTIDEKELININSSAMINKIMKDKVEGTIYFVNHQTISSYAKSHSWKDVRKLFDKLQVGIKVFDEAHLEFRNILKIDMFSNVFKTFYLTANFGRSDTKESYLFHKCFSSVYKFGEETANYEEKRRHIIYVPVMYRSNPSATDLSSVVNNYGFSIWNFTKYALHNDPEETQLRTFFNVYDKACEFEGRILITVSRIDDIEYLYERMLKEYPNSDRKIGIMHSRRKSYENMDVKEEADVIISTIEYNGTGSDIAGLRCVINLEPFSSKITSNQLPGRLREYAPDKDTYFFDLIDIAFKTCENQYKTKLPILRKKCKAVQILRM